VKAMNSTRILFSALAVAAIFTASVAKPAAQQKAPAVKSFYELKTTDLNGKPTDLSAYKGKVSLVVNVASKCGYTPQYEGLEKLNREMKPKGVVILGFPSNDFGGQEPGTAAEIAAFCKDKYDVTFPLMSKVQTKPGADQSPIYSWLAKSGNLPAWNFSKYVIDKNGQVVAFFPSKVTPDAPELKAALEKAINQ
jgi:glutathione peroxidase